MNFHKYKLNSDKNEMGFGKGSFEEEIIYQSFSKRRTIHIMGEITEKTELVTNHMIQQLCKEDKEGKKLPIKIKISSGGGDALAAFSIVDSIEYAKNQGYHVHTEGYSCVMSAAVPILSSGTLRRTQMHSRWMLHDVGMFLMGSMSGEEITRLSADLKDVSKVYEDMLVSKSKMTREQFREHADKIKEFYFWGDEAIKLGFADELL